MSFDYLNPDKAEGVTVARCNTERATMQEASVEEGKTAVYEQVTRTVDACSYLAHRTPFICLNCLCGRECASDGEFVQLAPLHKQFD